MAPRSRRIPGSRQYKDYNADMLEVAVDLVKKKKLSSYDAEKAFNIPRRTILNKVRGVHTNKTGTPYKLTFEEEEKIEKVLIAASDFGSPITPLELRLVVFDFLKKNKKEHIFNGKPPGEWWARNFIKRHNLTTRNAQNIKKARASKSADEINEYFMNLKTSLEDVPIENVMNYDETNLTDDPGSSKCIFKRKVKHSERIIDHSKSSISIMFAGTGDGKCFPPYVVYKSEHLWTKWCENGPENARYNRTRTGWFDMTTFEDWFNTLVLPWARSKSGIKVMIGDNLSSHLNVDIIQACEDNNIRLVFLPPNSTHLTQPLDVAFFGPIKKVWKNILLKYKLENPGNSLEKTTFPTLLKELMTEIKLSKSKNIVSGFRATGIIPFNPTEVLKRLPDYNEKENQYTIDQALLEFLESKRGIKKQPKTNKRNKKINVEPGKSVSREDIILNFDGKLNNLGKINIVSNVIVNASNEPSPVKSQSVTHTVNVNISPERYHVELDQTQSPIETRNTFINVLPTTPPAYDNCSAQRKTAVKSPQPSTSTGGLTLQKHVRFLNKVYEDTSDSSDGDDDVICYAESDDSIYTPELDEVCDSDELKQSDTIQKQANVPVSDVNAGDYVMVRYEQKFYPGKVIVIEKDCALVSAMTKCGNYWKWPTKLDSIWYKNDDIISKIHEPKKISRRNIFKVDEIQDEEYETQC